MLTRIYVCGVLLAACESVIACMYECECECEYEYE